MLEKTWAKGETLPPIMSENAGYVAPNANRATRLLVGIYARDSHPVAETDYSVSGNPVHTSIFVSRARRRVVPT